MTKIVQFPAISTPLTDANGTLNRTWQQFFYALYADVGALQAAQAAAAVAAAADEAAIAANTAATAANTAAIAAQATVNTATTAAAAAQTTANAANTTASAAVPKNGATAPSVTPFSGITVSNPPTQAEMQTISNALAAQSATVQATVANLQAVAVFL